MTRRHLAAVVIVLSLAAAGCDGRSVRLRAEAERSLTASEAATLGDAATGATGTPSAGATASADGSADPGSDSGIEALERELSAIEAELDALSLPTDADFRSAEDALF